MVQAGSAIPPIYLPASNSQTELVHTIRVAARTNRALLLEPGTHFTTPGRLNTIEIGTRGLEIGSGRPIVPAPPFVGSDSGAAIQRPDFSIPANAAADNFGLFFVPAAPQGDLSNAVWKRSADEKGNPFEYAVFVGGSINIHDVTLDCNMGRQGLDPQGDNVAEHSPMLGFAPQWYPAGFAPDGKTPRRAFVAFSAITLKNITTVNGGYADDILFTYFQAFLYPIIHDVVLTNVASTPRVGPHRASVSFAGPPARVSIGGADVIFLDVESDLDWKSAPRSADDLAPSQWTLNNVKAQFINFGLADRIIQLNATGLTTTSGCQLQRVGGTVSHSSLTVRPDTSRFYLLDHFTFDVVSWHFIPTPTGVVAGLSLGSSGNEASSATFLNNKFGVAPNASFSSGQLINSVHSDGQTGNSITATFKHCEYHSAFGLTPNAPIAVVKERGTWRFFTEDLHGRNPDVAIPKHPEYPDVIRIVAPDKTLP